MTQTLITDEREIKLLVDNLVKMKISKIISIDDEWTKLKEDYVNYDELTKEIYHNLIEDLNNEENFTEYEVDDIRVNFPSKEDFIESIQNGNSNSKFVSYINENLSDSNEVIQLKNLHTIFNKIKEYNNTIEIQCYDHVDRLNGKLVDGLDNCLYILDILHESESSASKNMIKENLIKLIISKKISNYLIVFHSHSTKDIESISDYGKRKSFIDSNFSECDKSDKLTMLYNLCSTSKSENLDELIENLYSTVYEASYGMGVLKYLECHKNAMIQASDKLLEMNFLDTDLFFKTSYFEGDCIIEQYSREISSAYKEHLIENLKPLADSDALIRLRDYEYLKLDQVAKTLTTKMRSDENAYSKSMEETKKISLRNSLKNRAHLQIANYDVNITYSDPSIGDIYVLNVEKSKKNEIQLGILVSQECDNIIRNKSRKSISEVPGRENDYFEILLFKGKLIKSSNGNDISDYNNRIFPIMYDNKKYIVSSTNELIRLPSFLLDICSLNKSGEALISSELDETVLSHKKYHSKNYYSSKHSEQVNNYLTNISSELKDLDDESIKDLMISLLIEKDLGISYLKNKFDLVRICRLNRDISYFILQGYVNKMFKIAREPINNEETTAM